MPYISTDATQRSALASELNTDPRAYGYAADITAKDDSALAEKINRPRAITIRKGVRSALEVMNCIDVVEFGLLAPVGKQQYIIALVSVAEGVDLSNDVIRTNLETIFPVGATKTRLAAAADKTPASRAEELWGVGTVLSHLDIAQALGRG